MSIAFTNFTRSDLPGLYQTDEVEKLITQMAKRVVFVRAVKRGSGILFKSHNNYYVQTCRHVVGEKDKITVIFGDTVSDLSVKTTAKKIGSCCSQDKAIYRLDSTAPWPSDIVGDIPDVSGLVVHIKTDNERKLKKALVEYDVYGKQYVIHSPIPYNPATDPSQYSVFFNRARTGSECKHITQCNKACSQLYIDSQCVPDQTKELFRLEPPWQCNPDWFVAVISFPSNCGKVKQISLGRPYPDDPTTTIGSPEDLDIPSLQNTVVLKHTADSHKGSSGGCVIIIGKDLSSYLGYKSYLGMHIGKGMCSNCRYSTIGLIN